MSSLDLAAALVDALDDDALDVLAAKLAPRLVGHLPETAPAEDGWIDSKQAAAYLGITTSTLWKLTAAHEIPFSQDGRACKCWFKRGHLDQWREGVWKR
jgi:excisionase family DNA binding protein